MDVKIYLPEPSFLNDHETQAMFQSLKYFIHKVAHHAQRLRLFDLRLDKYVPNSYTAHFLAYISTSARIKSLPMPQELTIHHIDPHGLPETYNLTDYFHFYSQ